MANRVQWIGASMILGAALPTPGAAELPSASEAIQKLRANDPADGLYVLGVVAGAGAANAYLNSQGKPMLYCQPGELAITALQVGDILERYVKKFPATKDIAVDTELLDALIDVFPYGSGGSPRQAEDIFWVLAEEHSETTQAGIARRKLRALAHEYGRGGYAHEARAIYERLIDLDL